MFAHQLPPSTIAEILGAVLALDITAEAVPLEIWVEQARIAGLEGYPLGSLLAMFRYYDRNGLEGNSRGLEWLLGRPPTTFSQFVGRVSESE